MSFSVMCWFVSSRKLREHFKMIKWVERMVFLRSIMMLNFCMGLLVRILFVILMVLVRMMLIIRMVLVVLVGIVLVIIIIVDRSMWNVRVERFIVAEMIMPMSMRQKLVIIVMSLWLKLNISTNWVMQVLRIRSMLLGRMINVRHRMTSMSDVLVEMPMIWFIIGRNTVVSNIWMADWEHGITTAD